MKKIFSSLRDFRRTHFGLVRIAKAVAVAIPTIAIGNWLLHFEVANHYLSPDWAYRANWPIITFLCFILNRIFTFSDRENHGWLKWVLISLIHSVVSQYLYPKLVHAGVNYMLASALMLSLGPVSFTLQSIYTFRKEKEDR